MIFLGDEVQPFCHPVAGPGHLFLDDRPRAVKVFSAEFLTLDRLRTFWKHYGSKSQYSVRAPANSFLELQHTMRADERITLS